MPDQVILIIEDDPTIGGLVDQVLREAGFRARWVRSVDAARAAAAEGLVPDAVLTDLIVAGSSGPTLLVGELAQLFPAAPVAIMTGVPSRRRAAMGVTHPVIIEKPFELETLLGTLRRMLAPP